MKMNGKRKQKKSLTVIFLLLLIVSVGFAYLTTNLSIFGNTFLKGQKFDVHFENVQVQENSVQIQTPQITENKTKVEYNVTLDKPGDFLEFTVDAKNGGTVDAMIQEIDEIKIYEGESETPLAEVPNYLDYSVTYVDGSEILEKQLLKHGEKVTYKVHVEYKKDITKEQLVKQKKSLRATFDVSYEQADNSAISSDKTTANLLKGSEINQKIKNLNVAGSDEYFYDENATEDENGFIDEWIPNTYESIKHIKKADSIDAEDKIADNKISTEDSDYEAYIYLDEATDTIYFYSEADILELNRNASNMFKNLQSLEDIEFNFFNTSEVENLSYMFADCYKLKDIDLSSWDTSNVTSMSRLFFYCTSVEYINLDGLNTENVTDMQEMFSSCNALKELDLKSFDTRKVEEMSAMFSECYELTELDLSNFNTESLLYMDMMFAESTSLRRIIFDFDVSKVEYLDGIFYMCSALESIDISNWDVSSAENTDQLFQGCTSLRTIDLSGWDTSSLTEANWMFTDCPNLTTIYVGEKFVNNLGNIQNSMFDGCNSLKGGNNTSYNSSKKSSDMFTIDGYRYSNGKWIEDSTAQGYLTMKKN